MVENSLAHNKMHSLLRSSIATNNKKFLNTLLTSGKFDLTVVDQDGYSPLMIAAKYDAIDVIHYLLETGVDIHYRAPDGNTALDCTDNEEIISILTQASLIKTTENTASLEDFNSLEWEWESELEVIVKEQNPRAIEKAKEVFDIFTSTETIDDFEIWNSSEFQLPAYLEKPVQIILSKQKLKRLASIFLSKRITLKEHSALSTPSSTVGEPDIHVDELNVALSCAGVIFDQEPFFQNTTPTLKEFKELKENDVPEFLDVVADERKRKHPLFLIHQIRAELNNRKTKKTEVLFDDIVKKNKELRKLLLQSQNATILLLYQGTEGLSLGFDERAEGELAKRIIIQDENNEHLINILELQAKLQYTVGSKSFKRNLTSEDKQIATSLILEIIKKGVSPNSLKRQCIELIDRYEPTTAGYERILPGLRSLGEIQTADSIEALLIEIQNLRYEIALQNYGLVPYSIKKLNKGGVDEADLHQEGFVGLVRGVERYDQSYGAKLSTYAFNWIMQRARRYREDTFSTIRYPVHFVQSYWQYRKLLNKYEDKDKPVPKTKSVAKILNVSEEHVKGYANYRTFVSVEKIIETSEVFGLLTDSLDDDGFYNPKGSEHTNCFSYNFDYGQYVDETFLHDIFNELLENLPERDRDIIIDRFGLNGEEPKTLEQIGEANGITRERVRQIVNKVMRSWKLIPSTRMKLQDFL